MKEAIQSVPTAQPCVVIRGILDTIKDAVLVVEKAAMTTFLPE